MPACRRPRPTSAAPGHRTAPRKVPASCRHGNPGAPRQGAVRPGTTSARLVRLLAQERGDVVLVHSALLQSLDGGSAITPDHRWHLLELVVVDRTGTVVGPRFLACSVTEHKLRLLTAHLLRHAEAGRHD